jgi:hypothetical protein
LLIDLAEASLLLPEPPEALNPQPQCTVNGRVKSTHTRCERLRGTAVDTVGAGLEHLEAGSARGWCVAEEGQLPASGATPLAAALPSGRRAQYP